MPRTNRHEHTDLFRLRFNLLSERSRRREKDKLLANAEGMAAGRSVRKTAEKLQVFVKKAFDWRHRSLVFDGVTERRRAI